MYFFWNFKSIIIFLNSQLQKLFVYTAIWFKDTAWNSSGVAQKLVWKSSSSYTSYHNGETKLYKTILAWKRRLLFKLVKLGNTWIVVWCNWVQLQHLEKHIIDYSNMNMIM